MFEFIGAFLGGLIFIGFILFIVVVWCEYRDRNGI
jgi:uncharacterized membrane protein